MIEEADLKIAPCLKEGPIAASARKVLNSAQLLGTSQGASCLRSWCVPYLFHNMERVFASGEEPTVAMVQVLERLDKFLSVSAETVFADAAGIGPNANENANTGSISISNITGEHYGQLFKAFSSTSYWEEPVRLLRQRLQRNGVAEASLRDRELLDAGCGGGRYTVAWKLLGTKSATGVDVSPTNISDAQRRADQAGITGVQFECGDVLQLPFHDSSFDIVFSNGVLHHTTDWQKGIAELLRVLRPGGLGWLYLIENPGGLFWDVIELLRAILKDDSRETAREVLRTLGIPANRIFYMLDHVMVPINVRLTPTEIEDCLSSAGAVSIRRLTRGTDFDRIEQIYRRAPFAETKYGVGENRYIFSKH
jgi:ubiquinone/menaquinone biosynthesis C-methylase UbiE